MDDDLDQDDTPPDLVAALTAAMREQSPDAPLPEVAIRPRAELTAEDRQNLKDSPNGLLVLPEEMLSGPAGSPG